VTFGGRGKLAAIHAAFARATSDRPIHACLSRVTPGFCHVPVRASTTGARSRTRFARSSRSRNYPASLLSRYRQISERLRRPLAAIAFLFGVFLLVEAIWLGRGGQAYVYAVSLLVGSIVSMLLPSGRKLHPPSESTLQWARKRRS
jgi:hypothetical protein